MKLLYHASPHKDLTLIKPQKTLSKDLYIGDFVFATSDIKLAAMYLATKGNATLMNYTAKQPNIAICSNPEDYLSSDREGAIYTVPDKTFRKSPQVGLEDSEMVSKVAVTPLSKQVYATSLEAMRHLGITVYFVNENTFNEIVDVKDEATITSKLTPYTS